MSNNKLEEPRNNIKYKKERWWKTPLFYLSSLNLILTALITIVAFNVNSIDTREKLISLREKDVEMRQKAINDTNSLYKTRIKEYSDSIRYLIDSNRMLLFHLIVQENILNQLYEENSSIYDKITWDIFDQDRTKNEIREDLITMLVENYYNSDSCLDLMINKTMSHIISQNYSLPQFTEIDVHRVKDSKEDLDIILRFFHPLSSLEPKHFRSYNENEIYNAIQIIKMTVESIIKANRADIESVSIKGNADLMPLESHFKYDGQLGKIDSVPIFVIDKARTTTEYVTIDQKTEITNLELAILRSIFLKRALFGPNSIYDSRIRLYAQVNPADWSYKKRNAEVIIRIDNAYERFFNNYYLNEDKLRKVIQNRFRILQKKHGQIPHN